MYGRYDIWMYVCRYTSECIMRDKEKKNKTLGVGICIYYAAAICVGQM